MEAPETASGSPVYSETIEDFYYHLDESSSWCSFGLLNTGVASVCLVSSVMELLPLELLPADMVVVLQSWIES